MIIELINKDWGWLKINAVELIDENEFGNLIFRSESKAFWRLIPEHPECIKIADNQLQFDQLKLDEDFQEDWEKKNLVDAANVKFGKLEKGNKFCLKLPAFLGGAFELENLGTVNQKEQISFSGDIAKQIHDLPNGTKFKVEK